MRPIARTVVVSLVLLVLSGCALPGAQPESKTLKVGVLPISDVVPMYVAQQEGYFKDEGIQVELVPVASGVERDALIQSGGIDGEMNEILTSVLTNAGEGEKVRIISIARRSFPEVPLFFLLSSPKSGITAADGLRGVEVAIGQNTVIEYVAERLLQRAGLAKDEIRFTNVPKIPVRLELLLSDQVKAAVMPDPQASLSRLRGARDVLDDRLYPEVSVSVLSFRQDVLKAQPNTVRAFLRAWDKATAAINADPARFRNILIDTARVPAELQDQYDLPPYPQGELPTPAQVDDVVNWALERGLIKERQTYEQLVDPSLRR